MNVNELTLEQFLQLPNQIGNLLNYQEIKEYNELSFPDNLNVLYPALKRKLENNPDYEIYVPLHYYPYNTAARKTPVTLRTTPFAYISNKGNVYHTRRQTKAVQGFPSANGYMQSHYRTNDGMIKFNINRAVASSFIPLTEEQTKIGYSELHSNHKDGVKTNNNVLNLEWMTHAENAQHGVDNNLRVYLNGINHYATKPLLATVLIPGEFEGFKFLRAGKPEIDLLMGSTGGANAHAAARGELQQAKGCKWEYATEDDIHNYIDYVIPDELVSLIQNHNSNFKATIIGKRISDGHLLIITNGPKEMEELGFHQQSVYNVCVGTKNEHRGYAFRRAVDVNDLTNVKQQIANQTTTHVKPEVFKQLIVLGTRVSDSYMKLFNGAKEMEEAGWVKSTVYRAVKKPGKVVNGWTFVLIKSEEELKVYSDMIAKQTVTE